MLQKITQLDYKISYTLQIFWLQKLQLLVVLRVRLQSGCDFSNYKLQLLLVSNIATKS